MPFATSIALMAFHQFAINNHHTQLMRCPCIHRHLSTLFCKYRMAAWTPRLSKPNCGRQCPDIAVLSVDLASVAFVLWGLQLRGAAFLNYFCMVCCLCANVLLSPLCPACFANNISAPCVLCQVLWQGCNGNANIPWAPPPTSLFHN